MNIVYQGEHSGVSVAVDGSTYSFENGVPTDVPSSVGLKLVEENPTNWRTDDEPPAEKPKKADKPAPDTKESK